jgi:hypothetical protein
MAPGGGGAQGEAAPVQDRGALLRAQEELRRDVARQMHDGPAQSLANIALQAEIVQRLALRGDGRLPGELESLRGMVQAALDTTKEFIFDVRPMVLDDLGLVPTLRRVVVDRGRRAGVEVSFDSQGNVRRIHPDLESGMFRIIAQAATGYVALRPHQLAVRLDWSDRELFATVRAIWADRSGSQLPRPEQTLGDDMPPALRAMIEQNITTENRARAAARSLAPDLMEEIAERARTLDIALSVQDDGATLDLSVKLT